MIPKDNKLLSEFDKKSFNEKKEFLLNILKELGTNNNTISDLIEIVNNINLLNSYGLTEVFIVILETIEVSNLKKIQKIDTEINNLKELKNKIYLLENEDKKNLNLESIINLFYN